MSHLGCTKKLTADHVSCQCLCLTGSKQCTEAGIQFLMLDTYHQLWTLLKQYTEAAAVRSGATPQSLPLSGAICKHLNINQFVLTLSSPVFTLEDLQLDTKSQISASGPCNPKTARKENGITNKINAMIIQCSLFDCLSDWLAASLLGEHVGTVQVPAWQRWSVSCFSLDLRV